MVSDNLGAVQETHARSYPVKFDNEKDQIKATKEVAATVDMLDIIYPNFINNRTILFLFLRLNNIAYNLDITPKTTVERFDKTATQLININPQDGQVYYFIGVFKSGAGLSDEGFRNLNKALELGVKEAYYSLGMLYLMNKDTNNSLKMLKQYQSYKPEDRTVPSLIEMIEKKGLEIKSQDKSEKDTPQ